MNNASQTCIAAATDGEAIWMGADSHTYMGGQYVQQSDKSKIVEHTVYVENGEAVTPTPMLMGFTGGVRVLNLIRHALDVPRCKKPIREYLVTDFVGAVRETLKENGAMKNGDNPDSYRGSFVVGLSGQLYDLGSGFDIVPIADNYAAAGSGQLYALGVLSTQPPGEDAVREALRAAEKHDPYVGEPFDIKTIGDTE